LIALSEILLVMPASSYVGEKEIGEEKECFGLGNTKEG
jgi:hypothetical protein